ncbi:hypothetical protein ACHAXS_001624, partial [Conticribra weissflogii]
SKDIKFITAQFLPTRSSTDLAISLRDTIRLYQRGGFRVQTLLMDGEFDKVTGLLPEVVVNTTSAGEHVGDIERHIRTIKERGRGIVNTLPYKRMPARMLIELVYFCVMWLNAVPNKNGVSSEYSPREVVVRQRLSYRKHCRVPFGAYCEVFEDRGRTNTMESRTRGAISLGPTGNLQGTYKFMCLTTRNVIKRRQFHELPMPASVIRKLEEWGAAGKTGELKFSNRNELPYSWNHEYDGTIDRKEPTEGNGTVAEFPGVIVEQELGDNIDDMDKGEIERRQAARAAENANLETEVPQVTFGRKPLTTAEARLVEEIMAAPEGQGDNDEGQEGDANDHSSGESAENTDIGGAVGEDEEEAEVAVCGLRRSTRANRGQRQTTSYAAEFQGDTDEEAMLITLGEEEQEIAPLADEDIEEHVMGVIMTQYGFKTGLKRFQTRGEDAVTTELGKLHMMDTFVPVHKGKMLEEELKRAVGSLMFLKEKRDQTVRGRMVADGRKQRESAVKGEAASPTVCVESIFITAAIEAKERRDVATIDLPSAYLHAENDETTHMELKGRLAELMAQVDPTVYRKYISVDEKGTPILYVRLHKAIYGLLKSALLFYRKLRGQLEEYGFTVNPYDPCVANKWLQGRQLTVTWHVDDLKVSHRNSKCVSQVIQWLSSLYGELKEKRGAVHDYLGITLDYSTPGVVRVSMVDYIKGIIENFPEEIEGDMASPAPNHLFLVRDESLARKLPEEQGVAFHHTVAQLLFLSTRARRDIQVAVAFLTTRVQSPDEDDWGKLKRVLKYLKGTINMQLNLSVDSLGVAKWYVDAAHAVHDDCKSHTGAGLTLGKGMVTSMSRKQKINGKSSTESKLIAVDDAMGQVLWTRYFIQKQGYEMGPSVIYQDNKSAILLETNGKGSTSKRTKHIKVRYFFVKDKINSGEADVKYCPKDKMWADVLTKPLQGAEFKKFRAKLMNVPEEYDDSAPFELNEVEIQEEKANNRVTFAPGTKPGRRRALQNRRPIYLHGRLQGCVGGARKSTRREPGGHKKRRTRGTQQRITNGTCAKTRMKRVTGVRRQKRVL